MMCLVVMSSETTNHDLRFNMIESNLLTGVRFSGGHGNRNHRSS